MTYRPHDAMRQGFPWLPVVLISGFVVIAVFFAWTYFAQSLWFKIDTRSVNHQNQVYQNSVGTQQSDISGMRNAIGAVASAGDGAQVKADVNEACGFAADISQMPSAYAGWVAQNCSAGVMSPGSPYNK